MFANSLLMIAGLLLLTVGAEGLLRGAGSLAIPLGVTPLVISLTIVAFGTGSPELFVGIQAAATGSPEIALGNVIGSNISNIALVLGIAAMVRPMRVSTQLVRREAPLMIGATALLCVLLFDGSLGRWDGLLLLLGAIGYTIFTYIGTKGRDVSNTTTNPDDDPDQQSSAWKSVLFLLIGLAALLIGASILLRGAIAVADLLGISKVVVGLTIIAIGTSLPELATSVTATLKGRPDVAFGNALGSNVLNITFVLGVVALIQPFEVQGLRTLDLAVLIGSAIAVLPLMARGAVLNRWEGGVLLVGYVAYIYSLVR